MPSGGIESAIVTPDLLLKELDVDRGHERRAPAAGRAAARQVSAAIHAIEPRSRANGPGARFVVWLQGCTLGCPGCFNPATHARRRRAPRSSID